MRYYDLGSSFKVTVSELEVDNFNVRWPCSELSGRQSFTFDKRGDLEDISGKGHDSEAGVALCEDAKAFGIQRSKTKRGNPS